jgi:hypothetical protein
MRLPFWEVSLFSQEPGQPAMIESIVCFSDSVAMRKYVHERRAESPTILLRTKYRTAIAPRQSPDTKYRGSERCSSLLRILWDPDTRDSRSLTF